MRVLVTAMNANDPLLSSILTGDGSAPGEDDTHWSFVPGLVLPPAVSDTWADTGDLQALTGDIGA